MVDKWVDLKGDGLVTFDKYIATKQYIQGFLPTSLDVDVISMMGEAPPKHLTHASRYFFENRHLLDRNGGVRHGGQVPDELMGVPCFVAPVTTKIKAAGAAKENDRKKGGGRKSIKSTTGKKASGGESECPTFIDGLDIFDIAVNLCDPMFKGWYNGKEYHDSDLALILDRSKAAGVNTIMITGTSLEDSKEALMLASDPTCPVKLYTTVGVHPTRAGDFLTDPAGHIAALEALVGEGGDRVVAVGECGLDYDRLHFCEKDIQLRFFEEQLEMSKRLRLPLFLHNRNTGDDFARTLQKHSDIIGGVVHSFTGTVAELQILLSLNIKSLFIGLNGAGLRTEEGLRVAKALPLDKLMVETDAPWCDLRRSHSGFEYIVSHWKAVKRDKFQRGLCVKNRTEPCHIRQVVEVIAAVKGISVAEVVESSTTNAKSLFCTKGH